MKRIAVLGAGGTGHAIAADLTLAGFEISLYEEPRFKESIDPILKRGGIEIKGAVRQGFAKISKVTTNIEEALRGSEIILVAVTAWRHESIAELCAPHLKDGQTIVIGPGNAGSLVFAKKLKKKEIKREVVIAEMHRNFYPCRRTGPAEVTVALAGGARYIAAFPAKDTSKVIDCLKGIYDALPGTNVLEVALDNPNIMSHVAGSLLNTGAIEKSGGDFYLYKGYMTPSILRCIEAVYREKMALFEVLGYTSHSSPDGSKKAHASPEFQNLIGPTSMQHRYITEDAATGQALMVSLGEMLNVPTPVTKALVTLASVVNQTNYLKEGRTVQKLGISNLTVEQLNRYLAEG